MKWTWSPVPLALDDERASSLLCSPSQSVPVADLCGLLYPCGPGPLCRWLWMMSMLALSFAVCLLIAGLFVELCALDFGGATDFLMMSRL